jgi:hypothetical protein
MNGVTGFLVKPGMTKILKNITQLFWGLVENYVYAVPGAETT